MKLFSLILLVALVQQEPLDREAVRKRLLSHTGGFCGEEDYTWIARHGQIALEELPSMLKEAKGEQFITLLYRYAYVAEIKEPSQTPAAILNASRTGSPEAAAVVLLVGDDRALAFLIEGLNRIAANEATDQGRLETCLLNGAGKTHSKDVGEALIKLLSHPLEYRRLEAVDALGNMGYEPGLEALKKLEKDKYPIPGRSVEAMRKIIISTSPKRAEKLVEVIRSRRMSGEFSWYRWALDQIVRQDLTETTGALREDYDAFVRKFGRARDGRQWEAVLLDAIHKLGGKLSPEETAHLTHLGRLPEAQKVPAEPEEAFTKGFDPSVWAPYAERQKQWEARRPKPQERIPEEKLPKFMKERIAFVMNLKPPDPSYLAPNAVLAMETIEEMARDTADDGELDKLLSAYLYLARLRDGMKSPDFILRMAQSSSSARAILVTIADDKAEEWYLQQLGSRHPHVYPGRLSTDKVKEALLRIFREGKRQHERMAAMRALADLGCVEILPEVKALKVNPMEIREALWRLEIFAATDRDARLIAMTKSMMRSGEFSSTEWGLSQLVRLNLKHLAPELRAWYDEAEKKWVSWTPYRGRVLSALVNFGAPISDAEREILRKSGCGP